MTVTLQDRVYFGAFWQILDRDGSTAALQLGNGYQTPTVIYSDDEDYFAGFVEKRNAAGVITDVFHAFAGAHGADAVQGEFLSLGIILDEPLRAAALYDSLLADPRYQDAIIHVTGHSLGAGYTQYVLAHSLATYGADVTGARADFIAFGAPSWLPNIAIATGVDPALLEGRFTDYTAANDPVLENGRVWDGLDRIGATYYLPPFEGTGDLASTATAPVASHWPTTYASALGLPDWMTAEQRASAIEAVDAQSNTGSAYDPDYGAPGSLGMLVWGSEAANTLFGRDGLDTIVGNGGTDVLYGGAGADVFQFRFATDSSAATALADRIADFEQGDRIDLSQLGSSFLDLLSSGLDFIGGRGFTAPGQVRSTVSGNTTLVQVNLDADLLSDFTIRLDGRHALDADNFILSPENAYDPVALYFGPDVLPAFLI